MATTLNLGELTADSPYIKKIAKALVKAVGQEIPIITPLKVKRVKGVSCKPIDFVFLGGQKLTLFVRSGGDVTGANLNDKKIILAGDFSNDYDATFENGVNSVAKAIRSNQKKFENQQEKVKVTVPPSKKPSSTPTQTPSKQLASLKEQDVKLQQEIDKKQATVTQLQEQLKSL